MAVNGGAGVASAVEQRRLLERVREQEGVIQRLWSRYTQDVGHEPDVGDIASLGGKRHVPARVEILHKVLEKDQSFDDAVDCFEFKFTHTHAEASTQRVASKLMHTRRPAVVARKSGDVVLRGFWGKGVNMPAFERLLQKLKGLQHGSMRRIDLSDNGINGNFVPGLIEIIRRGARSLDISWNTIESPAMQQLCGALPHIAQYLEDLDLRINPCSSDEAFVLCVANVVPEMRFLTRLGITLRTTPGEIQGVAAKPPQTRPQSAGSFRRASPHRRPGSLLPPKSKADSRSHDGPTMRSHSTSRVRSGHGETSHRGRTSSISDPNSYRVRSTSPPGASVLASSNLIGRSATRETGTSGASAHASAVAAGAPVLISKSRDASVELFRNLTQCTQLQMLDLRSSCLSANAAQRLAHFVRCDNLVVLGLADCFLEEKLEPVLEAVACCHKLVTLNLRLNAIAGHTGTVLAMALAESVSLTDVDLASNELDDDFGEAFARVLALNEVLWKVDLIRNPLGLRTGKALLNVLRKRNSSLITIGDTVDNFFSLGIQNRYQIQCHLEANRKRLESFAGVGARAAEDMDPSLVDFEFKILKDEPTLFEPLVLLR